METTNSTNPSPPEPDNALLRRLSELLDQIDPVPASLLALGEAAFAAHQLDTGLAELAELAFDSLIDEPELVLRADTGPRLLTFEASDLRVDLQIEDHPGRLLGQLDPPGSARIEVWDTTGQLLTSTDADQAGRFVVRAVPAGVVQLRCLRGQTGTVATSWSRLT